MIRPLTETEYRLLVESAPVMIWRPGTPVRVVAAPVADGVRVEVRNDGEIPVELLPVIFEPFRSGADERPRTEGLGLGLFIARAIVRAHKGNIGVESSAAGTTFRLSLPRVPIETAAAG
jgi:signal transduction histidine kinase